MWIFLPDAFLSVVAHRDKPGHMMVRSRFPDDLKRRFPGVKVEVTPAADYRYRVTVPWDKVAEVLLDAVESIDYPNFKGSVQEDFRHDAYLGVWDVLRRSQH